MLWGLSGQWWQFSFILITSLWPSSQCIVSWDLWFPVFRRVWNKVLYKPGWFSEYTAACSVGSLNLYPSGWIILFTWLCWDISFQIYLKNNHKKPLKVMFKCSSCAPVSQAMPELLSMLWGASQAVRQNEVCVQSLLPQWAIPARAHATTQG